MRGFANFCSTNPTSNPSKNRKHPCQISLRLLSSMLVTRSGYSRCGHAERRRREITVAQCVPGSPARPVLARWGGGKRWESEVSNKEPGRGDTSQELRAKIYLLIAGGFAAAFFPVKAPPPMSPDLALPFMVSPSHVPAYSISKSCPWTLMVTVNLIALSLMVPFRGASPNRPL